MNNNAEIETLSQHFRRQHLHLPPPPQLSPLFPTAPPEWPVALPIHFVSIRLAREKAFRERLSTCPSALTQTTVFHGTRPVVMRRRRHCPTSSLRPGEIGCDASHRKLWHKLWSKHTEPAYILAEDDANLRGTAAQIQYLQQIISEAQTHQVDLVYLGWYQGYDPKRAPASISAHLRVPFGDYLQLWCIYVTRAGLEKLVRRFPVLGAGAAPHVPIDVALRRAITSMQLKAAVAWPPLLWTVGAKSDTVR